MLPCPMILALQPRPCTGRMAFTPTRPERRAPFLSPSRNPPSVTRHSSAPGAREAQPSLPYSISTSFLPRRLVSPLLATSHSPLATSSHLTLLKSHCPTETTRNPQRITLFHKHQGVPQSFFSPQNHQIPIRHNTHKPNKKGHLCPTTPIANPSANTTLPQAAAAACSNLQITRPSALSTRPPKPNSWPKPKWPRPTSSPKQNAPKPNPTAPTPSSK